MHPERPSKEFSITLRTNKEGGGTKNSLLTRVLLFSCSTVELSTLLYDSYSLDVSLPWSQGVLWYFNSVVGTL